MEILGFNIDKQVVKSYSLIIIECLTFTLRGRKNLFCIFCLISQSTSLINDKKCDDLGITVALNMLTSLE